MTTFFSASSFWQWLSFQHKLFLFSKKYLYNNNSFQQQLSFQRYLLFNNNFLHSSQGYRLRAHADNFMLWHLKLMFHLVNKKLNTGQSYKETEGGSCGFCVASHNNVIRSPLIAPVSHACMARISLWERICRWRRPAVCSGWCWSSRTGRWRGCRDSYPSPPPSYTGSGGCWCAPRPCRAADRLNTQCRGVWDIIKKKTKVLYSAIYSHRDCSKPSTFHPLADLSTPSSRLLWETFTHAVYTTSLIKT